MPGCGRASPSNSVSTPAMILSSVDLPEPFKPSTPILAPGKKLKEMSRKMYRFGGTTLPTRFIVKMYWAMGFELAREGRDYPRLAARSATAPALLYRGHPCPRRQPLLRCAERLHGAAECLGFQLIDVRARKFLGGLGIRRDPRPINSHRLLDLVTAVDARERRGRHGNTEERTKRRPTFLR